jgi:hypothetical protein
MKKVKNRKLVVGIRISNTDYQFTCLLVYVLWQNAFESRDNVLFDEGLIKSVKRLVEILDFGGHVKGGEEVGVNFARHPGETENPARVGPNCRDRWRKRRSYFL